MHNQTFPILLISDKEHCILYHEIKIIKQSTAWLVWLFIKQQKPLQDDF